MKKLILMAVCFTSTMAVSAFAADKSDSKRAQMNSQVRTTGRAPWSGVYVGLHLGGGFGDNSIVTTGQVAANVNNVNGGARPALTSVSRSGILGGGQLGFDHQFGGFVVGAETDLAGSGIKGDRRVVTTALTGGSSLNNDFSSSLKFLGTARGRIGYAFGRVMVYGTGGLAYGKTQQSANLYGPLPANALQFTAATNTMKTGYAAGGGGEYMMSKKLSMKAEYLYYSLGSETLNVAVIAGSGGGGTGYNTTFENKGNIMRLGMNYRF